MVFRYGFRGGWGLQYDNPEALQKAKSCTHLWISHFHPDHLHMPTLKQLAALSPEITALANDSANFRISEALQQAGFKNIVPLYERRKLPLTSHLKVTRYPTAGIDNMLLIETPEGTDPELQRLSSSHRRPEIAHAQNWQGRYPAQQF